MSMMFEIKAKAHRAARIVANALDLDVIAHSRRHLPTEAPTLAIAEARLWPDDDSDLALTAGKIENLRIAARRLTGLEVPAGGVFSFWAHMGRPTTARGYVEGRELREGCMIASVGGGLCQVTNLLYQAAMDAGFEIIERHAHSRIVPGSSAALGQDATVFWNYLDLRFRSEHGFRIEVDLTEDSIIVRYLGKSVAANHAATDSPDVGMAEDCSACTNVQCGMHPGPRSRPRLGTAWIVDGGTPEFGAYFRRTASPQDMLILPSRHIGRPSWPDHPHESRAEAAALLRLIMLRQGRAPLAQRGMAASRMMARALAKRLVPTQTHLIISQSLLPHLWMLGVLGGRSYDVMMDRSTMAETHLILDALLKRHPDSRTLGDYRAPDDVVAAEQAAIARARKVITPHRRLAKTMPAAIELLEWENTPPIHAERGGRTLFMPGSGLPRRGAYELREAMRDVDMDLVIGGNAQDGPDFWRHDVIGRPLPSRVAAIVLPAHVSTSPRMLLAALAAGIPVIATPACGLEGVTGVMTIEAGSTEQISKAIRSIMAQAR